MRPIGELTLTLCGCVSNMELFKRSGQWDLYFENKKLFNILRREFITFNWDICQCYLDVKQAYRVKGTKAISSGALL